MIAVYASDPRYSLLLAFAEMIAVATNPQLFVDMQGLDEIDLWELGAGLREAMAAEMAAIAAGTQRHGIGAS